MCLEGGTEIVKFVLFWPVTLTVLTKVDVQ